jgi:hypothetical protein
MLRGLTVNYGGLFKPKLNYFPFCTQLSSSRKIGVAPPT